MPLKMPENPADVWIASVVPGRSFADVGGLWGGVNEKATVAHLAGASGVAMIDVTPSGSELWSGFHDRCRDRGVHGVECLSTDLNDLGTVGGAPSFDVVHCSGVLYHMPAPIETLRRLVAISRNTLILGTTVIPPRISNEAGSLRVDPGGALFVPSMTPSQREVVHSHFRAVGARQMVGINEPCDWVPDEYSPWWWLFTAEYVESMLSAVGLRLVSRAPFWEGRVAYFHTVTHG